MKIIKFLLVIVVALTSLSVKAQTSTSKSIMELLQANKWEMSMNPKQIYKVTLEFKNNKTTLSLVTNSSTNSKEGLFYLSNTPDTIFKLDTKNLPQNGRYLIIKDVESAVMETYDIAVNNSELILKLLHKTSDDNGAKSAGSSVIYKAAK